MSPAVGIAATVVSFASQSIIGLLVFAFTLRSAGPFGAFVPSLVWRRTRPGGFIRVLTPVVDRRRHRPVLAESDIAEI